MAARFVSPNKMIHREKNPFFPMEGSLDDNENNNNKITLSSSDISSLQAQAQRLRQEASQMRHELEKENRLREQTKQDKITKDLESLLFASAVDTTEVLRTVDQVVQRLQEERYSQEKVQAIFWKLCEKGNESRSTASPLMELLVDACEKMDTDDENPNKRWNGRVERELRRQLFALDWGISLKELEERDDRD